MATEGADQRYLLAREMGMWQAEAERTQNRLDDLQQGDSEAAIEQAWYRLLLSQTRRGGVGTRQDKRTRKNIPRPTSRTKALTVSTAKQNEDLLTL